MSKITKLFLDIDDTIIPTGNIICEIYNDKFKNHINFKEAKFEDIKKWDMTDSCSLLTQDIMKDIFNSSDFFDRAHLFVGVKEMIDHFYSVGLDIIFVSRGTPENISMKLKWISKLFPYSTQIPIVGAWDKEIDKDMINMVGGTFVDDKVSNLNSSNADKKILISVDGIFDKDWNKGWEGLKADSIDNLSWIISMILEVENK